MASTDLEEMTDEELFEEAERLQVESTLVWNHAFQGDGECYFYLPSYEPFDPESNHFDRYFAFHAPKFKKTRRSRCDWAVFESIYYFEIPKPPKRCENVPQQLCPNLQAWRRTCHEMVEAERERRRQVLRVIIKQDRQKKLLEERKKQVEPGTGWDVAHVSKGQLSVVKTSYEMEQYGSDSLEPQEKGLDRLRPHLMFVSVILSYSVMTYGVITQTEILVFGPLLVWAVGLFIYKLGVRAFTRFVAYPALLALGIAFFLFGTSPLWSLYLATVLTIALPIYFGPIWPFS